MKKDYPERIQGVYNLLENARDTLQELARDKQAASPKAAAELDELYAAREDALEAAATAVVVARNPDGDQGLPSARTRPPLRLVEGPDEA